MINLRNRDSQSKINTVCVRERTKLLYYRATCFLLPLRSVKPMEKLISWLDSEAGWGSGASAARLWGKTQNKEQVSTNISYTNICIHNIPFSRGTFSSVYVKGMCRDFPTDARLWTVWLSILNFLVCKSLQCAQVFTVTLL